MKLIEDKIRQTLEEIYPELKKSFYEEHQIEEKPDKSIVTEVDKRTEEILKEKLSNILKDSYFLGEESAEKSDEEYKKIFEYEYLWAVDPIDGTTNFANKLPIFAVSVGLLKKREEKHEFIAGGVLFPALDELIYTYERESYLKNFRLKRTEKIRLKEKSKKITPVILLSGYTPKLYQINNKDDQGNKIEPRILGCTVANIIYTALGKSYGTITSAHLWDVAGSLAIAKNNGINMYKYSNGEIKDSFTIEDFLRGDCKKDWKLKEPYLICAESKYKLLKRLIVAK